MSLYDDSNEREATETELFNLRAELMVAKYVTFPARKALAKLHPEVMDPLNISVAESIAGFANIDEFLFP